MNYRITKGAQNQAYADTLHETDSINSPRGPYQVHVTRVGQDVPRNELISLNESGSQTVSAPDFGVGASTVPGDSQQQMLVIREHNLNERSQVASHTASPRLLGHKERHMMASDNVPRN